MKKYLRFFFLPVFFSSCFSSKDIYKPADFDNRASGIQTIAVLPFKVTTIGYPPRYISQQDIDINNEKLGYSFQESLYNYLILHNSNSKTGQVKSFQPLQKTIALLKQHDITIANIYEKQPEEIAQLLGVDAVILTNVEEQKNWEEKTAYKNSPIDKKADDYTSPEFAKMNCYIYSADQSKLLWQTSCNGQTGLIGNTTVSVIEYFTSWVGKHFPFRA